MPFSRIHNIVARPKPEGYPKDLKTIGDHIRAWRMGKDLSQSDVAEILSICEDTVVGWEVRGTTPTMRQMPEIIKMIGYLPLNINISTFGERITCYRYIQGMTPKEFGILIPADASTVRDWEANRSIPQVKRRMVIENILKGIAAVSKEV